uniref:Hexosyltransferase n=1 Tax=Canis lupus dingo TaxID=286419 RepID=A0A8C0KMZ8_CANLU
MAVRSRRPWMSVALGLVLGFTAASWLIAPRVAELSERKRRGSSLCSYYGRSAAGPGAGAQQPLPQPQPRPRPEQSAPPARPELPGPPLPEAAPGVTSFRSSPWQQPAPLQQRRRGREPEGATGLPGAPVAEGDPEEEDGGAAGPRRSGRPGSNHNGSGDGGAAAPSSRPRDFLYVGVMTAQKYLGSRALAAQRTWARFIPGRVEFFSSEQSPNAGASQPPPPLPVIALPGVDDSYPPQKKSFMMIKYMHDHYLDKYEWFMRADDDVYIKGDLPAPAVPPASFLAVPDRFLCVSFPLSRPTTPWESLSTPTPLQRSPPSSRCHHHAPPPPAPRRTSVKPRGDECVFRNWRWRRGQRSLNSPDPRSSRLYIH